MVDKLRVTNDDEAGWIEQYRGPTLPASSIPKIIGNGRTLLGKTYTLAIRVSGFVNRGEKVKKHPAQDEIGIKKED